MFPLYHKNCCMPSVFQSPVTFFCCSIQMLLCSSWSYISMPWWRGCISSYRVVFICDFIIKMIVCIQKYDHNSYFWKTNATLNNRVVVCLSYYYYLQPRLETHTSILCVRQKPMHRLLWQIQCRSVPEDFELPLFFFF